MVALCGQAGTRMSCVFVREPPGSAFDVPAIGEPLKKVANGTRVFFHRGAQVAIVAGCSDVCRLFEELSTDRQFCAVRGHSEAIPPRSAQPDP